jgi:integrase
MRGGRQPTPDPLGKYDARPAGAGGDVVVVPLSEVGVLAWRMWLEHNPWDSPTNRWTMPSISNANRDWKDAMDRAGFQKTRCYDLVHSYCTQLLTAGGGDISLVQKARGHRDIRTTLICTQVVVDPRVVAAVTKAFAVKPRVAGSRGSADK